MARKLNRRICELLADYFTVLAHPVRVRILCALQKRPRTVSQIAAYAEVSLPNVSQHLRLLRDKGAVLTEKRAQQVYYQVADTRLLRAADLIHQLLLEQTRRQARQAAGALWAAPLRETLARTAAVAPQRRGGDRGNTGREVIGQ